MFLLAAIFALGVLPHLLDGGWRSSPFLLALFGLMFAAAAAFEFVITRRDQPTAEQLVVNWETRKRELQKELQYRVTYDEAIEMLRKDVDPDPSHFEAWHKSTAVEGDELWYFNTDDEDWEHLCGENGFVLIREGEIVDLYLWWMN